MRQNGFTLIEVLVVITIISILLAIATINFSTWTTKHNVEGEIKELYADLMSARLQAMNRNRDHIVRLKDATQYQTLADLNGDGDYGDTVNGIVESSSVKTTKNQMSWGTNPPSNTNITFNARGLTSNNGTISVTTSANAAYDCIVISDTRINMGRMSGGACGQK